MRHSRPAVLVATLTVLAVASGCGSAVAPQEWAEKVCGALEPWRDGIQRLTTDAGDAMSAEASPDEARKDLLRLLDGAAELSNDARDAVSDAGIPDVESGESIAQRFTDSLGRTADAYARAHDAITELDADDKDFSSAVAEVMERLNKDYEDVPQVAKLDSDELRDAFDSAPGCR